MALHDTLLILEREWLRRSADLPGAVGLAHFAHLRDLDDPGEDPAQQPGDRFGLAPLHSLDQVRDPALREQLRQRENTVLEHLAGLVRAEPAPGAPALPYWFGCLTRSRLDDIASRQMALPWTPLSAQALAAVLVGRTLADARGALAQSPESPVARARNHFRDRAHALIDGDHAAPIREQLQLQLFERIENGGLAVPYADAAPRPMPTDTRKAVIVHGTKAAAETWWRDPSGLGGRFDPSENLWQYLHAQGITHLVGHGAEFAWSGGHSSADRRDGARDFINWWHTLGCPRLDVVAHSHGGNVVMLALMMEPRIAVDSLVLLGTPASYEYVPRLRQTARLHNVYSQHDGVQALGAWITTRRGEGRTQSDGPSATNWHLPQLSMTGGVHAGHSDLHHPSFWRAHRLVDRLLR